MDAHTPLQTPRIGWTPLLLASLAACGAPPANPAPEVESGIRVEVLSEETAPAELLGTARQAADALGQGLMQALLSQLTTAGPEAALAFCADSAQALTVRFQTEQGVDVHRTSVRVRNSGNAADSAEFRVLAALEEQSRDGSLPAEYLEARTRAGAAEFRYYRPIIMAEGCLTCHGSPEQIPPAIAATLAERYPADAATGYAVGDFRGVIAVRVPGPTP